MSNQLPGEDLVTNGIEDIRKHRETVAAMLVAIGTPKLRNLGFEIPDSPYACPEHSLYRFLAKENSDSAHSRYNALIRRLVSFERAAACVKK